MKGVALEKVSFSDTQNPKTVGWHIESQWKALSSSQRQFNGTNSDPTISKTKNFFSIFFFQFLKYILNFKHLPKWDDPHRWCISGNTDTEKYGEINV